MTSFINPVAPGHCFGVSPDSTLAGEVICMKKKLSVCLIVVLSVLSTAAQKNDIAEGRRSYLAISAGLAVPIMCYASKDVNNPDAGFAKPGFSIDLGYAYRFNNTVGVTGSVFYMINKAGSGNVKAVSSPGSFRVLGLMAGPMLTANFSNRWAGDVKFLAGIAKTMTPELQYQDETLLNRYSATAFTWGGTAGLRYDLNDHTFLNLQAGHINLKPQFKKKAGETGKSEQHIVLMNFDAGVGLKF